MNIDEHVWPEYSIGPESACLFRAVEAARNPNSVAGMPNSEEAQVLQKLLRWPPACLFPALDIARLLALNGAVAQSLASTAGALSPSSSGLSHLGLPKLTMQSTVQFRLHANFLPVAMPAVCVPCVHVSNV